MRRTAPCADSVSVVSTDFRSNAERLMTFSTSAVAVCCCSDSLKIVGAFAQFLEQPRVLDGDHGLLGEILDQRDLLVGKRPDLLAERS